VSIPGYLEIGAKNTQATSAFFADLFGWKYTAMDRSNGWFQTPSIRVGVHDDDPFPQIHVFFTVGNLEQAIARVRSAGGQADEPGPLEPGFGRFCSCKDPTGITFGLHEAP